MTLQEVVMRSTILAIAVLSLMPILSNCESKDRAANIELKKENLMGRYFGVNDEGEDAFHVLQFNLYKKDSSGIVGDYYHAYALFDPIPQESLIGKGRTSITPEIFKTVKPHIGHVIEGALLNGTIRFKTDSIAFDEETKIAWEFTGKINGNYLEGELIEYFTPIYDSEHAIKMKGMGKVQTFTKTFTLNKIE